MEPLRQRTDDVEEWRWIEAFIPYYQVSNFGNVSTLYHRRVLTRISTHIRADLFTGVRLKKGGSWRYLRVHELVSGAFLDGAPVEHIDGDRKNNRLDNLEVVDV